MLMLIGDNAANVLKSTVDGKGTLTAAQIEKAWGDRYHLSIAWHTFLKSVMRY